MCTIYFMAYRGIEMKGGWKVGAGLLTLAAIIFVCLCMFLPIGSGVNWSGYLELSESKIHFWIEQERTPPDQIAKDIDLVLQINDYFWTTDRVFYFNITDPLNSGWRKRDTLIVDLTAINYSNRRIPFAFCYVLDVTGQRFKAVISNAIPFEESLFAGSMIEPGGRLRGKLAFAVPKGYLPLWIRCGEYSATSKIE